MGATFNTHPCPPLIRECVTHVVLSNNSCQSLPNYCNRAEHTSTQDSENLCKTRVSDATATLPLSLTLSPKGREDKKNIPSLEGRGSKGVGENHPSSGTMCHLLPHRGKGIKEILKRVQDDMNISLKRTYSPIHLFTYSPRKRPAFTLAEVLITLGIIGVVAAMTIPTLIADYKDKVLLNQAKNSYSKLSNALIMTKSQNGFDSYGELFGPSYTNDEIVEILSKNLKMVKICKENQGGCWNWKTKSNKKTYQNGKTIYQDFSKLSSAILSDGSVIFISRYQHNGDCKWTQTWTKTDNKGNPLKDENGNEIKVSSDDGRCGSIKIDVNGAKGPNQLGADTWDLDVYPQKLTAQYHSFLYKDKLEYENYQEGVE